MRNKLMLLLGILVFSNLFSQTKDSVLVTTNFKFEDGIYIDFNAVKYLSPININSIITNLPIKDIEFFNKLCKQEYIEYYNTQGERQKIKTIHIWGYAQNGTLYKNSSGDFFRIPLISSISQYVANVTVMREYANDPFMNNNYYYNGMGTTRYETKEAHTFIISFEYGIVYDYDYKNLEVLLAQDEELFNEYTSLKKREKKQKIFLYIRKYNEKHPLYLYKTN